MRPGVLLPLGSGQLIPAVTASGVGDNGGLRGGGRVVGKSIRRSRHGMRLDGLAVGNCFWSGRSVR